MSKDNPNAGHVTFKRSTTEAHTDLVQDGTATSDSSATARGATLAQPGEGLIDTERVIRTDQLDFEAFMRDVLLVQMHDPASEDDQQFAEVTVNGDYVCAVRGDQVRMRRYHVAVLANAKQFRVSQKKITTADGSMGYQEVTRVVLTYPFAVLEDPRGKVGADWLRKLIQTPT